MFNIESYLAPYIGDYLGKYTKNLNESQLQLSLWQGGATFTNVNLNLDTIQEELQLPFYLNSGRIHELKVSVPWTKLTSEPIVVNVNSIELAVSSKPARHSATDGNERLRLPPSTAKVRTEEPLLREKQSPPEPPGYMQSLINKVIHNIKIVCQNVVLKYVERGLELSFNIRNMTLCSVDNDWEQAFVELLSPDFLLRQKLSCSDLTVCLDKFDNFGRVYLEPVLAKCSFDVRILSQFLPGAPVFQRLDLLVNKLELSATDEQVQMLLNIYYSVMSMISSLPKPQVVETCNESEDELIQSTPDEKRTDKSGEVSPLPPQSRLGSWTSWVTGLVPNALFGEVQEDPDTDETESTNKNNADLTEIRPSQPVVHIAFHIDVITVTFKGSDWGKSTCTSKSPTSRKTPYLRLNLQGIVADYIRRGKDSHATFGIAQFRVNGVGLCPCGMPCCEKSSLLDLTGSSEVPFVAFGAEIPLDLTDTLFDAHFELRSSDRSYDFKLAGREEDYPEEAMLVKSPGFAVDFVEILSPGDKAWTSSSLLGPTETSSSLAFDSSLTKRMPRSLTRIIFAPVRVSLCSEFIHRIKRVLVNLDFPCYSLRDSEPEPIIRQASCHHVLKACLGKLEFVMYDVSSGNDFEAEKKIVAKLERIQTDIDIKDDYVLTKFQLHSLEVKSYVETENGEAWTEGECMGIILCSGDQIQNDITVAKYEFLQAFQSAENLRKGSTRSSKANVTTAVSSAHEMPSAKPKHFLTFTFTQVPTSNFQRKSGVSNPNEKFNAALERHFNAQMTEWHVPPEQQDYQLVSEFDVKLAPVDLILTSETFNPFLNLLKELGTMNFGADVAAQQNHAPNPLRIPSCNNNTLPLVYMRSGRVRVFLKADAVGLTPDTLLLQMESAMISCQFDNPLHRSILRPSLLQLARDANITRIPGSPIEDRQYQLDLNGLSISTCMWEDIEYNSPTDVAQYEIITLPVLDKMNVCCCFSPAMVYERFPISRFQRLLIAGHAFELNIASEINIMLNVRQINLVRGLTSDLIQMSTMSSNLEVYEPQINTPPGLKKESGSFQSEISSHREADSGFETGTGTSTVASIIPPTRQLIDIMPMDVFLAAPLIRITTYDLICLNRRTERSLEQDLTSIVGIIPLVQLLVSQPYLVRAMSPYAQRLEFSFYDFRVFLGSGDILGSPTNTGFSVPGRDDFPNMLFETIEGERDARTGIIPPFFICQALDFARLPCECRAEIVWPIRIIMSKKQVDLIINLCNRIRDISDEETETENENTNEITPPAELRSPMRHTVRLGRQYMTTFRLKLKQFVFTIHEEPPGLAKAALQFSVSGLDVVAVNLLPNFPTIKVEEKDLEENLLVTVDLDSLVITTVIGDRKDVFINPWNLQFTICAEWHTWIGIPLTSLSIKADPISIYFGPQNILAFLQIYHSFGNYIQRFLEAEEEEILEILEAAPFTLQTSRTFTNDLLSGLWLYVMANSCNDLPRSYQIAFCPEHGTMTWRYPEARSLTRVDTIAFPMLHAAYLKTHEDVELRCVLEYWDSCQDRFLHFMNVTVSVRQGHQSELNQNPEAEPTIACIWRVCLRTSLREDTKRLIFLPSFLAVFEIDSVYNPKHIQKLKAFLEIPRLSLHLVNHLTFGGKIPEEKLRMYTAAGGLTQRDQPFATLELSMTTCSMNIWWHKAALNFSSFARLTVLDYAYLTDVDVIDPFEFQLKYNLVENNNKQVFSGFTILAKPIAIKLGGSTLHTGISSIISWLQALKAYYGHKVDTSKNHFQYRLNMTQMIFCNNTTSRIGIVQIDTKKSQVIGSRECFAFNWTTQKVKPECCIGFFEGSKWIWSTSFSINRCGMNARRVGDKVVFIKIERMYASQRLITLSGAFTFANATDRPIEIGFLNMEQKTERKWTIESRSHGPSQCINEFNVEQFRFRLFDPSGHLHGWSHPVTITDLRNSKNKAKCIGLYRLHEGELIIYNAWCSLVKETVLGTDRFMIVVSPLFRARSSLTVPMSGKVFTAKGENILKFVLGGRGDGNEIDYLGPHDVVHHLTFQPAQGEPSSSPTIPLLPNGPTLENAVVTRPIDDILHDIMTFNSKDSDEPIWPYTGDGLQPEQWSLGKVMDTTFDATYSPWIEGLPAVLVDVKPWALFVNLSGGTIFFQESCQCPIACQQCTEIHEACNRSAFSPATKRGEFYIGVQNEKREMQWSDKIGITEEIARSAVHNINSNWKIPLDCFSRLDIPGDNQMVHLTIETSFHNGIFLLVIRPTYKIQNLTQLSLSVKGISLSSDHVPEDKILALQDNVLHLDPNDDKGTNDSYCLGLLTFNCDWDPDIKVYNKHGVKYIGIRYQGGPFWFVQLMKFESIFDNLTAPTGVSVKRAAVSIPNCQPQWITGTKENLQEVQIPLSVCWTCRNGQIWISISVDNAPQVIIHNESNTQVMYAEGNASEWEARNFPQFHCLGPFTMGFYTLPSYQKLFPGILFSYNTPLTPTLLLGRCRTGVEVVHKKVRRYHMLYRSAAQIQWSNQLRLDCSEAVQTIQVGQGVEQVELKVHIEKLGLIYYVYIEAPSLDEISAKKIRTRITDGSLYINPVEGKRPVQSNEIPEDARRHVQFKETPQVAYFASGDELHVLTSEELQLEIKTTWTNLPSAISVPPSQKATPIGTNQCPYLHSYFVFPEIRLVLTDDFTQQDQKREILSITLQDIYIHRKHVTGDKLLRCLLYKPAESWKLRIHVGDIQIDNALYQEKRSDFPVLLKIEEDYRNFARLTNLNCSAIPDLFERCSIENHRFMLVFEGEFSLYPSNTEKLFRVAVQCQSFAVNVEDQFLEFICPAIVEFISIITERIPQIEREHEIIQQQHNLKRRICPPKYEDHDGMEMYLAAPDYSASVRSLMDPSLGSSHSSIYLSSRRISISSSLSMPPEPSNRTRRISMGSSNSHSTNSLRRDQFGGSVPNLRSQFNRSPASDRISRLGSAQSLHRSSIRSSTSKLDSDQLDHSDDPEISDLLFMATICKRGNYLNIPKEIIDAITDLSHPILMDSIRFNCVTIYVTLRISKYIYLAIDHSPLYIQELRSIYVATTHFTMGDTIAKHFITGAIYNAANPVWLIGSLELLGSPGSLVRSFGTGFKDFVVYPLRGIVRGPFGFLTGFNHGCVSLVRNVGAGTLTSFTNWASSVSRNIDRVTLSQEEQQRIAEERRIPIRGVADGLVQGFSSFGVRLLGAIGGLAQHPIDAATGPRASALGVVAGISKGIFGFVTKPIAATVELAAKTGQGLLQGAGWTPNYERKYAVHVDDVLSSRNSFLKYSWKLGLGDERGLKEKLLLVVDATEVGFGEFGELTPVSLVITTENVYVMDTLLDQVRDKDPIASTTISTNKFFLDPGSTTELFRTLKLAQKIKGSHFFETL